LPVIFHNHYSKVISGELESYILFYYKGLNLLKENGRLCYITPDSWLTNLNCGIFREWLISDYTIKSVLDWYKPFDDAKDTRCHSVVIERSTKDFEFRVRQVLPEKPVLICRDFRLNNQLLNNGEHQNGNYTSRPMKDL
jgi:hypothetical protein